MKDEKDQDPENKKLRAMGRKEQKAVEAFNILITPPTHTDLAFIARELVLCTLPHSDPGNVPAWSRTNGNLTLTIRPGWNSKKQEAYGYPYGTIPRLILIWMVTEVLRTKSRRLELGHYLGDFMEALGLNTSNGSIGAKRSDSRRLREQMERLFRSIISFEYTKTNNARTGSAWLDMQVAPNGVLWWSEKSPEEGSLFGSWIEVGEKFYQAIIANPYPLDIRVLRHIKNSALGIDLYTILNREAYRASKDGKPRFIAWEWLYVQTGNEYTTERAVHDFRRYALEQIEQILEVHSGLHVTIQKGRRGQKSGLIVSNLSTPSIIPEAKPVPAVSEAEARLASLPPKLSLVPPPPQSGQQLRPATVAEFAGRYPVFDPYECKHAFDAWQKGLPEEKRAKHYDRAFLGFATKWVFGRT